MGQPGLRILVLGSGGREHAIVRACLKSASVSGVLAAPGNGGIAEEIPCHAVDPLDPEAVLSLAKREKVDLVVVGPEAPLAQGLADILRAEGIPVFGPGRDGARLEGSKAFAKAFMERHGIPTAAYRVFTDLAAALGYLDNARYPIVIKASGLAAGKGVIIAETAAEAIAAVRDMLEFERFGASGREVVIEEFLRGEEASLMLIVSGRSYQRLPLCQDHKRVGEGDTGPNTGGMGAYAPASVVSEADWARLRKEVIEPSLSGLAKEGIDYRGVLYIGLMLTDEGPKVLEYNCRLGDPECQVALALCDFDLPKMMLRAARGETLPPEVPPLPLHAVAVVVSAAGYPGDYRVGQAINLPGRHLEAAYILHAGTRLREDGQLVSAGGRVLNVVATGKTLAEALARAYRKADGIQWEDKYYRRDIGWRELKRAAAAQTSG